MREPHVGDIVRLVHHRGDEWVTKLTMVEYDLETQAYYFENASGYAIDMAHGFLLTDYVYKAPTPQDGEIVAICTQGIDTVRGTVGEDGYIHFKGMFGVDRSVHVLDITDWRKV